MTAFEILDFDTHLFGFKTARILPTVTLPEDLIQTLDVLKAQGVCLVYFQVDADLKTLNQAALDQGGTLVDKKTTFAMEMPHLVPDELIQPRVVPFTAASPTDEMYDLAYRIAERSRFGQDKVLHEKGLDRKMYQTWLENCVNGTAAKAVFVIEDQGLVTGMIILTEKQGRGDIVMVAVNKAYAGRGYGKMLVKAAQSYFIKQGFNESQVVTQLDNKPACGLYESCGYAIESVEHFYHFWL